MYRLTTLKPVDQLNRDAIRDNRRRQYQASISRENRFVTFFDGDASLLTKLGGSSAAVINHMYGDWTRRPIITFIFVDMTCDEPFTLLLLYIKCYFITRRPTCLYLTSMFNYQIIETIDKNVSSIIWKTHFHHG